MQQLAKQVLRHHRQRHHCRFASSDFRLSLEQDSFGERGEEGGVSLVWARLEGALNEVAEVA